MQNEDDCISPAKLHADAVHSTAMHERHVARTSRAIAQAVGPHVQNRTNPADQLINYQKLKFVNFQGDGVFNT
jgi:hypothetical protein